MFSAWSNAKMFVIEYPQGILFFEESPGLFARPSVLSGFMYWLSSSILPFSDDNPIPEKCSVLHTFSWDVSLFSALKEWRQFKQQKPPWCFDDILLNIVEIKYYPVEIKYYPLMISLNKRTGSYNVLSSKICVPKKTKDINIKAFNVITNKDEAKTTAEHISCNCKCKLNSTLCNSNQEWNNISLNKWLV